MICSASQIAIVEAFADLPDTRRTAGQRHHQALWHRLVYVRCCCRKSWISRDWGLVESPSWSISYFIWTASRALTLLQHDSADITTVRESGLFRLFIKVFWDSTFNRRNDCVGWQSITWVLWMSHWRPNGRFASSNYAGECVYCGTWVNSRTLVRWIQKRMKSRQSLLFLSRWHSKV